MPQRAPAPAEEMPLSSACGRERADAAERLRAVRERLDAVVFGLGELENLRQRQQMLIRTALEKPEDREARLSPEENILVLRRQLSLLRRREAVLMGPLQELDLHINQLRLDGQAASDQLETDSRPSSGFYELSDGASGSLSTSSHSVFSECFCSTTDTDGAPASTDASQEELADCEEFVHGLSDASSSSGAVCPSLSSAHLPPPEAEISTGSRSDPPASSSSLTFRYPSPLRTNAAQSPAFLQGGGRDAAETYSALKSSSLKHLDGYIYSLLQRRTQPVRTSRPRTSISADPTKSVLRQPSLCAKQVLKGSEEKTFRSADGVSRSSPPKSRGEELDEEKTMKKKSDCRSTTTYNFKVTDNLKTTRPKGHSGLLGSSPLHSSLAGESRPCGSNDQELLLRSSAKTTKSLKNSQTKDASRRVPELSCIGESTPTTKGRHKVTSTSSHHQSAKLCKVGGKNVKAAKAKTSLMSETSAVQSERRHEKSRHRSGSRRFQYLEDGGPAPTEVNKRGTSVSLPEDPLEPLTPFRTQVAVLSRRHRGNRHRRSRHLHDHQVIVAGKPKHSRHNCRRLHSISENQRCAAKREEGQSARTCPASKGQQSIPYPRAAESDSEYSAECVSLFHSTIADTSEDEDSDYTANRFGDSECSGGEAEDSATDTEESAGAGAAIGRSSRRLGQFGTAGVGGQAQMKTLVRVKASYKLKKKILRFRSGSLKLMTTM
ncbi:hypothetical protein OJAV_G00218440 [Oryzias javanicus]|uniref:Dishevelled binding antagonist of beta catenin 1 n=1 Tax=Oryzias javanicus TaxID=123683 RepID=A0A437C4Q1_ORYJA|nr:hypothetical protein OJAV_G00218440 [Oryzias javanicus]